MRNLVAAIIVPGALAMFAAGLSPAFAESTRDRVEVLERAVSDLQARAPAAADGALKVGRMEEQIQQLTGRVEELSYKLEQANARIESMSAALAAGGGVGDVYADGADGDGAMMSGDPRGPTNLSSGDPIADAITQSRPAAVEPSGDEAEVALPIDPNAAFDYASAFLLRGDYPRAQKAFETYLETFPNHPRTADAQFRLGEIYLATGANADAADTFIRHIKAYPNDPRAAEAYLKLGSAFARMEQNEEACKVFKSMRSKYPNASPPVRQRADVEMARIDCR